MHDIDRALFEMQESEADREGLNESQEMQLAGELLEIAGEQELDRFLGNLLSSAVSAGRSFLASDAGRAVGGLLKSTAKQALPQLGRALGDLVAPGVGGQVGSRLATAAGTRLGLELEGMSAEDRELEVARAFVRFADGTARGAAAAPPGVPPAAAAVGAAKAAAQQHLPALAPLVENLRPPTPAGRPSQPRARRGRWERRGHTIVLFDV